MNFKKKSWYQSCIFRHSGLTAWLCGKVARILHVQLPRLAWLSYTASVWLHLYRTPQGRATPPSGRPLEPGVREALNVQGRQLPAQGTGLHEEGFKNTQRFKSILWWKAGGGERDLLRMHFSGSWWSSIWKISRKHKNWAINARGCCFFLLLQDNRVKILFSPVLNTIDLDSYENLKSIFTGYVYILLNF